MEIKISHKPVAYEKAIDFLEQRVEKVHANLEDELIWILEHDSVYTKGISASDKDLLLPNLFPVIATNRGGKFTYHGPGQKIVHHAEPSLYFQSFCKEHKLIYELNNL